MLTSNPPVGKGGEPKVGCPTLGTDGNISKSLRTTTRRGWEDNPCSQLHHSRLLPSSKESRKGLNLQAQGIHRFSEIGHTGVKRDGLRTYSGDYWCEDEGNQVCGNAAHPATHGADYTANCVTHVSC